MSRRIIESENALGWRYRVLYMTVYNYTILRKYLKGLILPENKLKNYLDSLIGAETCL
jgi:hypothetical protein